MATYFVNASGSSTPPFSSAATGAHTLYELLYNISGFGFGDIVEVVNDGEIDASADPFIVNGATDVTIRSWSGNSSKPTMKVNNSSYLIQMTDGTNMTIQGLKLYKAGPSATSYFFYIDAQFTGLYDTIIEENEIWVANTTGMSNCSVFYFNNSLVEQAVSSLLIQNNKIFNLTDVIAGTKNL